jgi:hypothetical protein
MTTFSWLKKKYRIRSVKNVGSPLRVRSVRNRGFFERFLSHWATAEKHEWPNQPWYTGTGLHYNQASPILPKSKQVCGNADGRPEYQDTIGYDTEISTGLMDGFGPFSSVRCKITQLSGKNLGAQIRGHVDWHRDESPFEALRVIIPLVSDNTYQFQIENMHPVSLIAGHAYAFDQSRYHRVYSNGSSDIDRIHLILSFVTWFDRVNGEWVPSPFASKVHPLDLFDMIEL